MLLFVNQVHYAILLYLYGSFLLESLMFSLNIKQLPWNSCEVIILPNHIKFENHLLINPSASLTTRENSSRFSHWKKSSLSQCWLGQSTPHTCLSFQSVLGAEEASGWWMALRAFSSFCQINNNQNYLGTCLSPPGTPYVAVRFELTPVSSVEMPWTFLEWKHIKLGILPLFITQLKSLTI